MSKHNSHRTQQNVSPIERPMTAADEVAQEIILAAMDAWSNPAANLGYGSQSLAEGTEYPLTRLTQNYMLLYSLYRGSGILRRIINKPVEDAVSHWFKIDSQITPDQIDALERLERRTKIKKQIEQGIRWGQLFGGAAALIMIDGQGDQLDQPLDIDSIEPDSFKGIYVVDRWSGIYPSPELVDDIGSPAFGEPEYYQVRTDELATKEMRVHHSRILRFTGDDLPYWEKQVEQYWGSSKIETIFDSLKRYDNTLGNIAQLIFQANVWTQKSDNLEQMLSMAPTAQQNRLYMAMQAQQRLMSSFNTRVISKEDDLENHPYAFSGLDKVFEVFQYDMSSVTGIPITILFGRSAAGLDATGDADMDNYYTLLEGIQENKMRPALEQLMPILCMSEFGAVPDDINVAFNPVRVPTEKEKADIANTKTTAITAAFTAGAISQQIALKELRAMADSTGMWSNITDEDIENADNVPDVGDIPTDSFQTGETFAADSDFDESKHPRSKDGKFGNGSESEKNTYESKSESLTIGKNGGILKSSDFERILIRGMGKYPLVKGSKVTNIYNFAGKGTKRAVDIESGLIQRFGGHKGDWQHTTGNGYLSIKGKEKHAEIHWFQEPSVGIRLPRVKRWIK